MFQGITYATQYILRFVVPYVPEARIESLMEQFRKMRCYTYVLECLRGKVRPYGCNYSCMYVAVCADHIYNFRECQTPDFPHLDSAVSETNERNSLICPPAFKFCCSDTLGPRMMYVL